MLNTVLLLASLTLVLAAPTIDPASSIAGSTVSFSFPPVGATFTAYEAYFPDASEVGYPGPTPTGDEAEAIQTAPAAALNLDAYPLVNPLAQYTGDVPSFNTLHHWGNLGPWYSVGEAFGLPGASPQIPAGCELTQVHLLHRHGARYPTSGSDPGQFAAFVHSAAEGAGFTATGPLEFLNSWTYKLGAEILTPFGREQLYELGVGFRVKYGELLKGFNALPVWRTTSEERMVDSALQFAAGFFGVQQYQNSYYEEIIVENSGFNNTLSPWNACPNSNNAVGNLGGVYSGNWTDIYLNGTVERLQEYVTGLELNTNYVFGMQQLCAYETVALGYSDFCDIFTVEEWLGFEYANDLSFWYSNGPGSPVAAAQGIGYVQELVSRLTQTPLTVFDTSTNGTLDGNPVTFPLNQPIYVDATHDTVIAQIVTALNFTTLAANGPLPVDHIPAYQTYHVNQIAPFGSNLVGQVVSCPASPQNATQESFIRFILNDGVVPLTGIAHCETPNPDGLCPVADFVQGMQERIAQVNFNYDCFADYPAPYPDDIIDGREWK
ncbi:histidine phosphatase superfamily [Sparassis latifolia]